MPSIKRLLQHFWRDIIVSVSTAVSPSRNYQLIKEPSTANFKIIQPDEQTLVPVISPLFIGSMKQQDLSDKLQIRVRQDFIK